MPPNPGIEAEKNPTIWRVSLRIVLWYSTASNNYTPGFTPKVSDSHCSQVISSSDHSIHAYLGR